MGYKELSVDKVYNIPKEICKVKYNNVNLIIYTEGCNWLVLTDQQLNVFNRLCEGVSVENLLNEFDEEEVISPLIQIEAKEFENTMINTSNEKNLFVYLTNRCNLRCEHCYMYSGEIEIDELSVQEWKDILLDFKESKGTNVTFSGGEITVYKGFKEILEFSKKIGLENTVLSNGTLWDDETINEYSSNIDEIQISLDGYDEKSNSKIRGKGTFDISLTTINKFAELGVKVSVAVTPLYDNIDDFCENFKGFAKELLTENPSIFIKLNLELIKGRNVSVTDDENKIYRQKLKGLVNEIYPDYYIKNFIFNYSDKKILSNCGYGEISIAPNGDVYMCNRIHELESNINVKNMGMKNIMEQAKKIKERTSVNNVNTCRTCPIKYICGGGCRLKYENISYIDSCENTFTLINKCSDEYKNSFYDKMIDSNEYFFKD